MWFMGAEKNKCVTDMLYTIRLWYASLLLNEVL